ncbi:MAG: flagellar filament capping protein FliD, partial [Candidatus Aureabacteria bacterium]|nr:flagellar filament capping protein FliD [Candidatus Auribacterota bacterium]
DEIIMTSKVDGQDIVLKNDTTSGFLDAIHILDATGDQDGDPGKSTYIPAQSTVVVNGTTMHTDGNTLTISGTTFTFLSTGTSTVKVEPDHDKIVSAVGSMVYAYNAAVDTINQVREAETTSASGSTMLTRILTGMRSLLIQEVDNPYSYHYITDIGLSFSRGESRGKLELDETKLRSNLSTDTDSTVSIFSYDSDSNGLRDNGGIANVMKNYLYEYTRATGFIGQRQETISDSITQTQNQIQRKEDYFSKRRDILIETLVKMQTVLQQLEYNYTQAQAYQINFIKS